MPSEPEDVADRRPDLEEVTALLLAAHGGDAAALDLLAPRVYDELRDMAGAFLQGERTGHTLQPTALVNEVWLRLMGQDSVGCRHRAQFFSMAATLMRRILVDHARRRNADKRGAGRAPQPLDETVLALEQKSGDLIAVEQALEELGQAYPSKARLVELRFFLGLPMRDAAAVLDVSLRKAQRDWAFARAWMRRQLGHEAART